MLGPGFYKNPARPGYIYMYNYYNNLFYIYIYIYIVITLTKMPHLTHNLFRLQSRLSFLSSTHSPLLLLLTLLSCLSSSASLMLSCLTPSASLMLSASRSHYLCRRRWRRNPKILAAKILGLTLSSHFLCRRRWRQNPKILIAKILGLTLLCSHVLFPFFLYLISRFGDLDSLCLTCGFGDLDFVVKIWCSLHVLVLDFDFKCIWFLWIVWFHMYLVSVNRKFEWVWWIWFEIHLGLLFVLHCCCDSFFLGKQKFFLIDWASKFFFFFGWATNWAQSLNGARGARGGRFGPQEKNSLSKRAGSRPQVLARGSGPGMEKPNPNSTHCHS